MGKGQVSIEFMLVLGFMFLLIAPLLVLYYTTQKDTQDTLTEAQMRQVGNTLRDAAERLYFAGEPAQETLQLYFPDRVKSVSVSGSSFVFTLAGGSQQYDLLIPSVAPLNGSLQSFKGIHVVTLRVDDGVVQIHD